MAKKEERIAIYVTADKIIEGGYGDFYNTIPYKKDINKMAKALEENLNGSTFNSLAEAALNALLEEQK